jgi:heterotetrameric sarcosine oxidase gamma subunit
MLRESPLKDVVRAGRYGADKGAAGVTLSVVHSLSLVMVIARKGKAKTVKDGLAAMRRATVMWAGPDQYYVKGAEAAALKKKLGDGASIIDQSHGRVTLRISGPKARALLAKGTPVDLHDSEFPIGKSAVTQMAHVGVHLTRTGNDEFELSVFRGFSESFWEWLAEQALEFGYQVA